MVIVAGRSTRPLDRMQWRSWLALSVIAVWGGQLLYLWPLPSAVISNMAEGADAHAAQAIAEYGSTLWIGWLIRIVAIPLGIGSGVLLSRNHPRWPIALSATSIVSLAIFRPWQWSVLYAPLFGAGAGERASWLLGQPRFLFNTLVFSIVLVLASIVALVHVFRRRADRHAI
jgi:hypothetical protein